jgi:hypothetical protein
MNTDEFTYRVSVANAGFGRLAFIFLVLRCDAARGIRVKNIVFADGELAFEIDVRDETRARADCDGRSDDALRSDFGVRRNIGTRVNNGSRVDGHPMEPIGGSGTQAL